MTKYRTFGKLDDQYRSEGDTFFTRMNARLRPTQLQPGEVQLSQNGRMQKDGTWQPRKGLLTLSGAITIGADALRLPYQIASAQRSANVVTITLSDTPSSAFVPGNTIFIEGLTSFTTDPNGQHTLVDVSFVNKRITFAQTAGNESFPISSAALVFPASSAVTKLDFTLNDDGINEVFGSAVFSDPNSDNIDDYIFTATNNVCDILRLRDSAKFKVKYQGSNTISGRCDLLQAFNKVFIFRGDKTSLESKPVLTSKAISSASRSGYTITVNCTAHGREVGEFVTLSGLGNFTDDPNTVYKVITRPSVDQFTVTSEVSGSVTYITSGATAEHFNDFTLVPSGDYTIPSYMVDTAISAEDGEVAVSETNHGLDQGDDLEIIKGTAPLDLFVKQSVKVSEVIDAHNFKFNLDVENVSLGQNVSLVLSKPQAISHFVRQPATPFAVINQRRLWMPYFYDSAGSPQKRSNNDEIIASDILDSDTFDAIGGQLKITGGSSDFIVGLEPFTENTLVVFARRSIHQVTGVSGSLADVQVNVITPEVGCSARRSIVQIANKIFFLSDQGVYGLEFLDQYNLRGLEVPLSEAIQPYIDRINQDYVDKATGAFFNQRYYLAIPIDGSTENNIILVYNTLNQGWESIDSVDSTGFNVRDMLVAREGAENALYITTSEGGVHKVEGFDGADQVSVQAGTDVPPIDVVSKLTTREYDMEAIDRKVFSRGEIHVKSDPDHTSNAAIDFNSSDPDSSRTGTTIAGIFDGNLPIGEDASIRTSVRLRGYGCSVSIAPSQGRPFVRLVKIDARLADRSQTSTI